MGTSQPPEGQPRIRRILTDSGSRGVGSRESLMIVDSSYPEQERVAHVLYLLYSCTVLFIVHVHQKIRTPNERTYFTRSIYSNRTSCCSSENTDSNRAQVFSSKRQNQIFSSHSSLLTSLFTTCRSFILARVTMQSLQKAAAALLHMVSTGTAGSGFGRRGGR